MNPSAIYSKSGKGVQEASGKTSLLKRGERAVLSAIDGRSTLADVAQKVGKPFDAAFEALITQLDKDGFVREVSAGMRPKAPAARGGAGSSAPGADLDFTTIIPIPKAPPKPGDAAKRAKEQESALYKARQEAEERAQAERDRLRAEAEAKARAEVEAKVRAEAEAQAKARSGEFDAKAKAARDAALRVAAEAKAKAEAEKARLEAERAKLEAERKVREEAERQAREEAEKARREAEELRQRLEEERKAREEAERKAREEEERRRKEEEARRAREEAERKAREEEARRAREEAERKAREEAERRAREEEEQRARRAREEEEQRARRAREEEEERARKAQEEELERARREAEEARAATAPHPVLEPEPAPAASTTAAPGSLDTLMADLDSFSQREEDDRRSRDAAERKAKDEKARVLREESERRAREQAETERRAAEERRRKEEEQRRAQEEAERRAREAEEALRQEAEERSRKARESMEAAQRAQAAQPAAPSDDIGVTEQDLDMEDVRRDEALVAKDTRKAQREREAKEREREARERERAAKERERRAAAAPVKPSKPRRPVKWGRSVTITLVVLLAAAVGILHVVPIPTEPYERAASEALGRPVRIASAGLSLYSGVRLNLKGVKVGDTATFAAVSAYPEIGSLFGESKRFSRIELDGATVAQQALGEAMVAKLKGENFSVRRVVVKQLKVQGGVALPPLEVDAQLGNDGMVHAVTLHGPDDLVGKVTPSGDRIDFDVTASSFPLPVAPQVSLKSFAMKGTATRQGMNIASWGGGIYDGALSGVANIRWTGGWQVDGVMTARNVNAAVFAPALLSEGRAEGTAKFSMRGQDPGKLAGASRIEGKFTVFKGALGSFDLSRLIQTSGRQSGGRTQFAEMTGQGVYERGAVALRDVQISAGALNAGASADIAQSGALSGRIVADVKTATQTLRQTIVLGGTVKEPQVRN